MLAQRTTSDSSYRVTQVQDVSLSSLNGDSSASFHTEDPKLSTSMLLDDNFEMRMSDPGPLLTSYKSRSSKTTLSEFEDLFQSLKKTQVD